MKRFVRFMLSGTTVLLSLLLAAALCTGAVAQTTKSKIPTAPQVAMKKKPDFKGRQGVMRGTTNTERWHAAIKRVDRRAAQARAMHDALQVLQECFCEMATLKVATRLARTLLRLAQSDGCGRANVRIAFTCEELGQMAGTTLFTVSRLLSKWTEMGILYAENRGTVIDDMGRLAAIANGPGETSLTD